MNRQPRTFIPPIPPIEAVHVEIVTGKVKVNNAVMSNQMGGWQQWKNIEGNEVMENQKGILKTCESTFDENKILGTFTK